MVVDVGGLLEMHVFHQIIMRSIHISRALADYPVTMFIDMGLDNENLE